MTIPIERTKALLLAGEFLKELSDGKLVDAREIQRQAKIVLRHYPDATLVKQIASQVSVLNFPLPILAPLAD